MSAPCPSSFPRPPAVLICGFGAFGRLVAQALAPHVPLAVCDPDPGARAAAQAAGLPLAAMETAAEFDVIVLAVPVPALEPCLAALAPHLRPGQLVVDVCSVKEGPAALMRRLLPAGVEILATHPMFGPRSLAAGLAGGRIVLCPLRGRRWRRVAAFLRRGLGLEVVRATPEEHDRHAALTQGLTHVLARALAGFAPHPRIRTRSFDLMAEALAMVGADAPEVFEAVTAGNPHVAALREALAAAIRPPAPADAGGA